MVARYYSGHARKKVERGEPHGFRGLIFQKHRSLETGDSLKKNAVLKAARRVLGGGQWQYSLMPSKAPKKARGVCARKKRITLVELIWKAFQGELASKECRVKCSAESRRGAN